MIKTKHHRRSVRLPDYDYSQAAAYFITLCTWQRECLFGEIIDDQMRFNEYGEIVNDIWNDLPNHYLRVALDIYMIMPNHFHGIIFITSDKNNIIAVNANKPITVVDKPITVGAGLKPAPTLTRANPILTRINMESAKCHKLSEIIRGFKTFSSRRINQLRHAPGIPVWQRNYYEHVVRQGTELDKKRKYIAENPFNWDTDEENIYVNKSKP